MENEKKLSPLDSPSDDSGRDRKLTELEKELLRVLFPRPEPVPYRNPFKPIRPAKWKEWD